MKVVAFVYKITKEEEDVVHGCLTFLGIPDGNILVIPSYRPAGSVESNSVVLTFGKFAELAVDQYLREGKVVNVRHEKFPHPKQLTKIETNKEARAACTAQLKLLKEFLDQKRYQPVVREVKEGDLPDLSRQQILLLKKMTEEAGETSAFQVTRNGKLIEISVDKIENSKADIHLTFAEIFTVRTIMDTLKVTEVNLALGPSSGVI
jgi:hypothetical protein